MFQLLIFVAASTFVFNCFLLLFPKISDACVYVARLFGCIGIIEILGSFLMQHPLNQIWCFLGILFLLTAVTAYYRHRRDANTPMK